MTTEFAEALTDDELHVSGFTQGYKDFLAVLEKLSLKDQSDLMLLLNKRLISVTKARGSDREIIQLYDAYEDLLEQAVKLND